MGIIWERKVYLLIASDSHMSKEYDKIVCISDERNLPGNVFAFLRVNRCSTDAAYALATDIFVNRLQLQNIYSEYNRENGKFIENSLIEDFTLRIEEKSLNEVETYL
jgi:hypothetical protein